MALLTFNLGNEDRPRMAAVGEARPPRGLSEMCRDAPGHCRALERLLTSAQPNTADDDAARLALLHRVTRRIHDRVEQRSDAAVFGRDEVWRPVGAGPWARGDCEDIALEKLKELIEAGFPRDDLFLAVAYRGDIGLHAVLIARMRAGDLVLDNQTPELRDWTRTGYAWIVRQKPDSLLAWGRVQMQREQPDLAQAGARALQRGAAIS